MKPLKTGKTKWLHIRLTPAQHLIIKSKAENSTCGKLSEYARYILLDKPVVTKVRNASLDDLMTELILLRKELSAIGNNYNQMIRKLNSLSFCHEVKTWLVVSQSIRESVTDKIDLIKLRVNSISEIWLQ
ncbi:plasmid mobilization protein [Arachidicoccus terrestris]|uniref:plasmid mobilization protein n=1 Tax=Arachidicoccus terrestris TaxID=2875539 RepID=UPI001CC76FF8|nr:plasmid mobilization relaxosome protein MobC [Arachidicoccus terrestris]UAY55673.1 plasmid mobilization relaxosome protein MobC [Arachidicoccus terrestris]